MKGTCLKGAFLLCRYMDKESASLYMNLSPASDFPVRKRFGLGGMQFRVMEIYFAENPSINQDV